MPKNPVELSLGVSKLPPKRFRTDDQVKIDVKAKEALFVGQGDYVVVENDKTDCKYLETDGAGPCVVLIIRGPERTLLTHIEESEIPATSAYEAKGTRAAQNLSEMLGRMLDLVSPDNSKIESIGIVSGTTFRGSGKSHASEVMRDILGRQENSELSPDCTIAIRGGKNDAMVNLESGEMLALSMPLDASAFVNKAKNGNLDSYPSGVQAGQCLDLISNTPVSDSGTVSLDQASAEPTLGQSSDEAGLDEDGAEAGTSSEVPSEAGMSESPSSGTDTSPTADVPAMGTESTPESTYDPMFKAE